MLSISPVLSMLKHIFKTRLIWIVSYSAYAAMVIKNICFCIWNVEDTTAIQSTIDQYGKMYRSALMIFNDIKVFKKNRNSPLVRSFSMFF